MLDFNAPIVQLVAIVSVLITFGVLALLCLWIVARSIICASDKQH
jgi:phage shock protein PspC (stress-responsive transcriptional regulator)